MHVGILDCSAVYSSQDTGTTCMSINRGRDKEDVLHTHDGILLSHEKGWNNAICSNTDGPGGCHTEWNKSEIERHIYYFILLIHEMLRNDTNELTKQKQTHRCRKIKTNFWLPKGKGGGINYDLGISRYKTTIFEIDKTYCIARGTYSKSCK